MIDSLTNWQQRSTCKPKSIEMIGSLTDNKSEAKRFNVKFCQCLVNLYFSANSAKLPGNVNTFEVNQFKDANSVVDSKTNMFHLHMCYAGCVFLQVLGVYFLLTELAFCTKLLSIIDWIHSCLQKTITQWKLTTFL